MQSVGKLGFGGHKTGLWPAAAALGFYIVTFCGAAAATAMKATRHETDL